MLITPFAALLPYIAVAAESFKTSIEIISDGFRFLKISSETISPSMIYKGVAPFTDALPLMDTFITAPVSVAFFIEPYPTTTTSSNFAFANPGLENFIWSTFAFLTKAISSTTSASASPLIISAPIFLSLISETAITSP